ncbi:MAG: replicative DNA helicase, partial [Lachnospiraceae bacterium]|nr:replicative DNA helicase [Lachnospiraceae bacterium]
FDTIVSMYNAGKDIDLVTLMDGLKAKDAPEEVMSFSFFNELTSIPTSSNAASYENIVYDKSIKRKLIKTASNIENMCYSEERETEDIMDRAEKSVFNVLEKRRVGDFMPIRDIVLTVIDRTEAAAKNSGSVTGIATGFTQLDYKTAGLQPSDLVLIAARPSMGKTAFALNIAQYTAVKNHVPTAIFSLEMPREQLVSRMLSMHSHIESQQLRVGNLSSADWERLVESAGVISDAPLYIDDTPSITVAEIRSKCRKLKAENDIKLVLIDYLQLMGSTRSSRRGDSRQQEVSDISRALKALARELNVPVVALSQLSRKPEERQGDHRPILSDLRESGAIEQDADVVMFLYRDDYYHKDSEKKNITEIIIAKQRNGPIGTVELAWLSQYTQFANLDRRNRSRDDQPQGAEKGNANENG